MMVLKYSGSNPPPLLEEVKLTNFRTVGEFSPMQTSRAHSLLPVLSLLCDQANQWVLLARKRKK